MTKRVVFAGGVQVRALARAYRQLVQGRDEDVVFMGPEAVGMDAERQAIAAAHLVVTDASELGDTVTRRLVSAHADLIAVPVVSGAFLWPYAGRPHPRNRGTHALPGGPYPADFGDGFLDSMLLAGVSEDEAVQRYLAFDVAGTVDLDALLRDTLSLQAALDARTGFGLARFITARFREGALFATRDRLGLPLFRHLAAALLDRMGLPASSALQLQEKYFEPGEAPIHPAVLRHFGLPTPPDHLYPVLDEGLFTFEQHCRRYLRYEWNEALHAAIALAGPDAARAVPALRQALKASPGSQAGQAALRQAEQAAGGAIPDDDAALSADTGPGPRPSAKATPVQQPRPAAAPEVSTPATSQSLAGLHFASAPTASVSFGFAEPAPFTEFAVLAHPDDSRFADMPETMPPPPSRPVLPPERPNQPSRPGLIGRLFGKKSLPP